jgi:hypothetical protein
LIIVGLCVAGYFFLFFDPSVEVPKQEILGQTIGGGRVVNIGLMADRQNGIIIGLGLAILGAILMVVASRKESAK